MQVDKKAKRLVKRFLNTMRLFWVCKKRHCIIKSRKASVHANYGFHALIDENVVVTDDVIIGDYSYVNKNSSIERCKIGNFCSISSGVWINPFEHDICNFTTHPLFDSRDNVNREFVVIGNDVLISLNAIILSGVTIGDGAVIGAGAVVTKNVSPYEIVGGVPAKHLKWRFTRETIESLQLIEWWKKDVNAILGNPPSVNDNKNNKY